jgi:hypothetical protein
MTDKQNESGGGAEMAKPLTLRELTKWRLEAVKLMLAGNGAGFLGVGAGLVQVHGHGFSMIIVKIAGLCFFVGLLASILSFMALYAVLIGHNQALHARNNRDFGTVAQIAQQCFSIMERIGPSALVAASVFALGVCAAFVSFVVY